MSSLKGKLGFRVLAGPPRLSAALVDRFRGIAAANLADAMGRFNFMDPGIQWRTGLTMCGPAVTVNARPADNLMIHKALQVADPGDVIVVNTCGNTTSAVFGELMCNTAVAAKLGGIVVDGAIRDVAEMRQRTFPVYARGVTHRGPYKDGPGAINVPITVGGMPVNAGDIIVGDQDGLLAFPPSLAATVIEKALAQEQNEHGTIHAIREGRWDRAFVDTLEARCAN